jgi:pyridoxine 4-dehydrogenase
MALPSTCRIGGDLTVSRLGFGTTGLTDWDGAIDRAASISVVRAFVDLGGNFIDTADAYDLGLNEELIAEALHPYPPGVVIATKVGLTQPSIDEWVPCGRPEYLRQQVELCRRRLRVDRLDLLQLHRLDPLVPLADQIGTLAALRAEGAIRHIGLSEVSVAELIAAREIAPIATVQNFYNITNRQHEDVLDYCTAERIPFIPFLPVANGSYAHEPGPLRDVALDLGAPPVAVALSWLLHRSPVMLPIPGTVSLAHLAENMGALGLPLPSDQLTKLDAIAS